MTEDFDEITEEEHEKLIQITRDFDAEEYEGSVTRWLIWMVSTPFILAFLILGYFIVVEVLVMIFLIDQIRNVKGENKWLKSKLSELGYTITPEVMK